MVADGETPSHSPPKPLRKDTPIARLNLAPAVAPQSPHHVPHQATGNPHKTRTASLKAVLDTLEDHKALDIVVLDIAQYSGFADDMVIVTGTSTRHLASIAQALTEHHKHHLLGQEGMGSEWICTDLGSIVVHTFSADKRALYNLEKLWSYNFTE